MRYADRSRPGGSVERLAVDLQRARPDPRPARRPPACRGRRGPGAAELELVAVVPHRVEQAAHLGERGAARLLDVPERLAVLGLGLRHPVADGPHLEHHHADGVRDDVVELARDPSALLGHRDPGRRLPVPLGPAGALLRGLGLLGPLAQGEADEPADREQHGGEDEVAGRVVGLVVDDDRRAAEHDRQADAGLHVVAQVAEQQGGTHPGDEDPGLAERSAGRPGRTAPRRAARWPRGRRRGSGAARAARARRRRRASDLEPQHRAGRAAAGRRAAPYRPRSATAAITMRRSRPCFERNSHARLTWSTYVSRLAAPRPTKVGRPPRRLVPPRTRPSDDALGGCRPLAS